MEDVLTLQLHNLVVVVELAKADCALLKLVFDLGGVNLVRLYKFTSGLSVLKVIVGYV